MFKFLRRTLLTILFTAFASQASAMWIQADWLDPTVPGVGTNRYAYSGNDPVNNYDSNGNFFKELGAFFGGVVDGFSQQITTGGLIPGYQPNAEAGWAAGYQLDAALGIGQTQSHAMSGPGIGHNGGPSLDDDDPFTQGPNDPDPSDTALAAIAVAAAISTANPDKGQSATPRSYYEELVFEQVSTNPDIGKPLPGLNNDPKFRSTNGWQMMEYTSRTSQGNITVHYQTNPTLQPGRAFDLKVVNNSGLQ